jgi:hypothetical protein
MPLRGSGMREINVSPSSEAGVIDLGRLFGSKKGLDPTADADLAQIKAVAQGYASGAYDDSQIEEFLQKNPSAETFILPVVQQVKTRKEEAGKYFNPGGNVITGGVDDQMVRYEQPRADVKGAMVSALSRGDVEYAAKLQELGKSPASESPFGKVDPKDYTPESIRLFRQSGDYAQLVPREKPTDPSKAANDAFDQESKLRGEYTKLSNDFIQVRDAYGRIQESAAGDLALIFNYMKMLDPGSTVREGEFATAQNSAGIPDRVRAQYNKAISGERLADTTRTDFVKRAGALYDRQKKTQEKNRKQYEGLARKYKLDPSRVITDQELDPMPQKPVANESKVIGGKTYVKVNGKWFEQ